MNNHYNHSKECLYISYTTEPNICDDSGVIASGADRDNVAAFAFFAFLSRHTQQVLVGQRWYL